MSFCNLRVVAVAKNKIIEKMDELDDPSAMCLITMVLMLSLDLIFINKILIGFKSHFIRRTRASVSTIMCELGMKSKNYYRMRGVSFWKLHDALKDEMNENHLTASRRSRKKRKKNHHVPNGLTCSSLRLSIALRVFAGGSLSDTALVHGVSKTEVHLSV